MIYKSAKMGKIKLAPKIHQSLSSADKQAADRLLIIGAIMSKNMDILKGYETTNLIIEGHYIVANLQNNRELVMKYYQVLTEDRIKFLNQIVVILQGKFPGPEGFSMKASSDYDTTIILSLIFGAELFSRHIDLDAKCYPDIYLLNRVVKYGNSRSIEILLNQRNEKKYEIGIC